MVAAQDEEVFRILDLVCQQQADGLQRLLASIDVVSEEEVVRFWREAAVLEQAEEVIVLPVYVAADLCIKISVDIQYKSSQVRENVP